MTRITPYLFILPAFISLVALIIYPLLCGFGISFFNTNLASKWDFVGMKNYTGLFKNADFTNSLFVTLRFCILVVCFHFIIGTILGISLNRRGKGITLFRTILILPWVFPEVVVALIFKWILNPVYGLFNAYLMDWGVISQNISWLGNSKYAFIVVVVVCIWKGFPMVMINVLAALQSVSEDIYEAARVDGANGLQTFFHITLPSIKPVLATTLILDTMWWFKHYTMIALLTQGGPNNTTSILSVEIQKQAFSYFNFGTAAAMSVFVFFVCLLISKVFRRILGDED